MVDYLLVVFEPSWFFLWFIKALFWKLYSNKNLDLSEDESLKIGFSWFSGPKGNLKIQTKQKNMQNYEKWSTSWEQTSNSNLENLAAVC